MMMQGTFYKILSGPGSTVARVVAGFEDTNQTEVAKATIDKLLCDAVQEVDALLQQGGGQASSADASRIFVRCGLGSNIDWGLQNAPWIDGDALIWDIPVSVDLDDLYALLSSLGAKDVCLQEQISAPWLDGSCPMSPAWVDSDCNCAQCHDGELFETVEPSGPSHSPVVQKRTLH